MSSAVVILAAGLGSRMVSEMPKVLHRVAGEPMLAHVLATAAELEPEVTVVITGHGAEQVEALASALCAQAQFARQAEQLGTGHAVLQALPALEGVEGDVFILYGDTPFIRPDTLEKMRAARASGAGLVVLGFEAAEPAGYGRLVREGGELVAIVEERDADAAVRALTLCNSGVMCVEAGLLRSLLPRVGNENAKGEYYLTDLVALARGAGARAGVVVCGEAETLGVNSRADLAAAEAAFQAGRRREMMEAGVTLTAPETVFFARDTMIGADTVIGQNVVFGPGVTIENGAEIRPFCHLEGCHVSSGAQVGPYARLRPGAELGADVRVGNFVEIKEAQIDKGAKINHLSYVGDASVGEAANLGAGTITCNYDGVMKHRTRIGARAFIGSNGVLVAPVGIGDDAFVAAGSVITSDVAPGALALARGRQENKPGLGLRLRERLKAIKAGRAAAADKGKG
ncbi:bifunctional UDP-N-acetylglucosamine diphosphorylase/glucosamine-1-phosphate N-acetyltransferase GlmU [Paroceanicella profunda]|uniref:Bifunctional protein GlmU n=1 Tax=Paroceanicella profunda TaxID=2579971 RepID=A0A5B8FZU7_9RHOB|nr:bifunctional UDP-N-acetylglucosamine diphosphorylase/glucosamine-1-phosphate N-acetyltransferase GlmU [Paroceanicella profunda]QDL92232.1 bifunctional UDP-N-acetylglucosamine diphosphorylase/glucosamine-1-phosphate N-acetyltransferase GlmU [Paroceanicella profunda]